MQRLSALFSMFGLVGICLAVGQEPASTSPSKEPAFEGKALSHWIALGHDKDPENRMQAIVALRRLGLAGIPALTELLKDDDLQVRRAAVMALDLMPESRGGPPFPNGNPEARTVKLSPEAKAAIPVLTELLKDKDEIVWQAAAESLARVGPEAKTARGIA